jgi:nucleotidyltransferase substrate binding protein (TIGR01987 family)
MALDQSLLEKAVARLAEGLARYQRDSADDQIRDGLIQRFEFTYDLAPKILRRHLEAAADSPGSIDLMTFPSLIRTGWEQGLLQGGWPAWHGFRDMCNTTSHLYDEAKAVEVAAKIPAFLEEVQFLVQQLNARPVS